MTVDRLRRGIEARGNGCSTRERAATATTNSRFVKSTTEAAAASVGSMAASTVSGFTPLLSARDGGFNRLFVQLPVGVLRWCRVW
eukprot:CAMPEP_0179937490 /NCGR_PEP_ID=MMETSP0983-20121128/14349_1 /TAXON_ID=483367 /ORGANISM="non described non described, Strain CCMP 2436" /LENGTH=84 /DNA_ID=CAMNT_0021843205 /DNA_START=87 /DNA_END=338 /DNA_ORIENTATION=-